LKPKGSLATPGESPSYLRASPDGRFLYAASPAAKLLVFAIGADGGLTPRETLASPGGPCYVDVHPSGRWVATANYGAGKTLLYPAEGAPRESETGPQTHSARFHPGGKYLYALSVGGRKITRLALDGGAPWTLDMPDLGPRHIAFSPQGELAFVVHEMPIRVSSLRVSEGALEPIGTWPALAPGAVEKKELAAAEIAVAGRFVYASVRDFSKEGGLNGLAVYAVEASGALTWVEFVPSGGVSPRGFVLDPSGAFCYVLNEIPGTLKTFRVESGRLLPAGDALPLGGKAIGIAWARLP
jgi:6-phosphogluconolactonase